MTLDITQLTMKIQPEFNIASIISRISAPDATGPALAGAPAAAPAGLLTFPALFEAALQEIDDPQLAATLATYSESGMLAPDSAVLPVEQGLSSDAAVSPGSSGQEAAFFETVRLLNGRTILTTRVNTAPRRELAQSVASEVLLEPVADAVTQGGQPGIATRDTVPEMPPPVMQRPSTELPLAVIQAAQTQHSSDMSPSAQTPRRGVSVSHAAAPALMAASARTSEPSADMVLRQRADVAALLRPVETSAALRAGQTRSVAPDQRPSAPGTAGVNPAFARTMSAATEHSAVPSAEPVFDSTIVRPTSLRSQPRDVAPEAIPAAPGSQQALNPTPRGDIAARTSSSAAPISLSLRAAAQAPDESIPMMPAVTREPGVIATPAATGPAQAGESVAAQPLAPALASAAADLSVPAVVASSMSSPEPVSREATPRSAVQILTPAGVPSPQAAPLPVQAPVSGTRLDRGGATEVASRVSSPEPVSREATPRSVLQILTPAGVPSPQAALLPVQAPVSGTRLDRGGATEVARSVSSPEPVSGEAPPRSVVQIMTPAGVPRLQAVPLPVQAPVSGTRLDRGGATTQAGATRPAARTGSPVTPDPLDQRLHPVSDTDAGGPALEGAVRDERAPRETPPSPAPMSALRSSIETSLGSDSNVSQGADFTLAPAATAESAVAAKAHERTPVREAPSRESWMRFEDLNSQFGGEIRKASLETDGTGRAALRIMLAPENMGTIEAEVIENNNTVTINIVAQTEEVVRVLRENSHALREAFAGHSATEINIFRDAGGSGAQHAGGRQSGGMSQRSEHPNDSGATVAGPGDAGSAGATPAQLDTYV